MAVPTLTTARLLLRAHHAGDFPALAAMWADPAVVRFIGGVPSPRQDCWFRLLRYAGLWPTLGYGYWAVEERATGLYIGDVGFADFKRLLSPSIEGVPELGWALASAAHGKGYGTEAVTAALAWGDAQGWERVVCIIDAVNEPSVKVARKAGFKGPEKAQLGGKPIDLYERRR